jgi:hypothetical protein
MIHAIDLFSGAGGWACAARGLFAWSVKRMPADGTNFLCFMRGNP